MAGVFICFGGGHGWPYLSTVFSTPLRWSGSSMPVYCVFNAPQVVSHAMSLCLPLSLSLSRPALSNKCYQYVADVADVADVAYRQNQIQNG